MSIPELHKVFLESDGICTDTRKLRPNQLYFALKGENFNGNKFAQQALESGALKAIIDDETFQNAQTIIVDDVLETLQKLATYHRNYLNIPIIGLTGSNGKTTTKELINSVLSQKFKIVATQGNFNNHIGVPLTLLAMNTETEIGIVEMGANHQKEIEALCKIAQPNYGLITNYGKAHLEGFGGMQGVIKGKSEMYQFLAQNNGTAFVYDQDPIQIERSSKVKTTKTYGSKQSDYPITLESIAPHLIVQFNNELIDSKLIGSYNFTNIAIAIVLGSYFEVPIKNIKIGIANYIPENNRSQIITKGTHSIILDAYNANPTSMAAALINLQLHKSQNTIAFIGDMFEIGDTALAEHQEILKLADTLKINQVYAIGPSFGKSIPENKNQHVFESYDAFAKAFINNLPKDSTILIKGSRGMKMERILDLLLTN